MLGRRRSANQLYNNRKITQGLILPQIMGDTIGLGRKICLESNSVEIRNPHENPHEQITLGSLLPLFIEGRR